MTEELDGWLTRKHGYDSEYFVAAVELRAGNQHLGELHER